MGHYVSFVIQSWRDPAGDAMCWQVRCADEAPLSLPDGAFVVRTWIDDDEVVRGLIRHVQSGQEMQFQSSRRALEFIRAWMDSDVPARLDCDLDALVDEMDLPVESDQRGKQPDG
jgi:hypothetical protein